MTDNLTTQEFNSFFYLYHGWYCVRFMWFPFYIPIFDSRDSLCLSYFLLKNGLIIEPYLSSRKWQILQTYNDQIKGNQQSGEEYNQFGGKTPVSDGGC